MSVQACAALVERADPLRFRAAMAAPLSARPVLFAIYALNVEVARAPWVTEEPMIAEMRLQWWRDALEEIATGVPVRKHEVVDALAQVLDQEGAQLLDGMVAARRWDIYKDAFEDAAHFDSYLDATSGHVMWTAARLLGRADEAVVRDFAYGVGLANFFAAIPDLEERGRRPLVDGTAPAIAAFAFRGLAGMDRARAARVEVSRASGSALVAGFAARPMLRRVQDRPARVAQGTVMIPPFAQSLRLLKVTMRGWWS